MTDTTYREIEKDIGNWTKELIADEQAFLTQATKINSWDNQLIHNANQVTYTNLVVIHSCRPLNLDINVDIEFE